MEGIMISPSDYSPLDDDDDDDDGGGNGDLAGAEK